MNITYFVPGTDKVECRVLNELSAVIVELAGGKPSTEWDKGYLPAKAIETAANELEHLPEVAIGEVAKGIFWTGGSAVYRGNGMIWYGLGYFKLDKDLRSYLKLKADKLRAIAAEATAADTQVFYG